MRPPPHSVYVASRWSDAPLARRAMAIFRDHGCTITHDWTTLYEKGRQEPSVDEDAAYEAATADYDGAVSCDVFVLIVPPEGTGTGCWIEFGAALAAQKLRGLPACWAMVGPKSRTDAAKRSIFALLGVGHYYERLEDLEGSLMCGTFMGGF